MAAVTADILVGSIENLAAQSFVADDGAPAANAATLATGDYYLRHTSVLISLIDQLASSLASAGVTNPLVVVLESGLVRISGDNTFHITWGSATELRRLLGYTGDLSGTNTYTASEPSPLLLIPGYPFTTPNVANVDGYDVDDVVSTVNADFTDVETDFHNTGTFQEWTVDAVPESRFRNANTIGGNTFYQFRKDVLVPGYRFFWYEAATINFSGTSAITWPTTTSVHGPYKRRTIPRMPRVGKRKIMASNALWGFNLDGMVVSEYG